MPRGPNGVYTPPVGNPVEPNTVITSEWANSTIDDISQALTDSLSRDNNGSMRDVLLAFAGSVIAPGLGFVAEANTGMYLHAPSDLRITVGGVDVLRWLADGRVQIWRPTPDPGQWDTVITDAEGGLLDSDNVWTGQNDFQGVTNVLEPTEDTNAANKKYVDDTTTAGTQPGDGLIREDDVLNVGQGTGIVVNPDDVAFDQDYGDERYLHPPEDLPQRSVIINEDKFPAQDTDGNRFSIQWGLAIAGLTDPLRARGAWDAESNIVTLDPLNTTLAKGQPPESDGADPVGWFYIVNKPGVFDLTDDPGPESWQLNDKALWLETGWARIPAPAGGSGTVETVFGRPGPDIVAEADDYDDAKITNTSTAPGAYTGESLTDHETRLQAVEQAGLPETDIDQIRYSKLDNPITHLFKKNKLVDTLQGELSWQRDSAATYVDRYGVVRYSPSNVGANDLFYSEDFGQAAWTKVRSSVDSNVAVAPDGTITADKHVEDNSSGTHFIQQPVFNTEANAAVALSVFCKAAERTNVVIQGMTAANWAERPNAVFDLSAGTVTETVSGSATIAPLGNGWYRCTAAGVFGPSIADGGISVFTAIDGNSNYQGDGISGIYIWGAQGEISRVANAYVRTTDDPKAGIQTGFGIDQSREEAEGWLIEGESTNLLLWSEEFDNARWNKSGATTVTGGQTGPDNNSNAYLVEGADSASLGGNNLQNENIPIQAGDHTVSFYARNPSGNERVRCRVTLANSDFDSTLDFENVGQEWIRLDLTFNSSSATTCALRFCNDSGNGFELTFIQVEPLPFPSSYIPTTDAAVTRARDDVTCPLDMNRHGTIGSIACKFDTLGQLLTTRQMIASIRDIGAERYEWRADDAVNNRTAFVYDGGNASISPPYTGFGAVTFSENGVTHYSSTETANSPNPYSGNVGSFTLFYFGQSDTTLHPLFGHIQDFRIYDIELNPDEIKFLAGE